MYVDLEQTATPANKGIIRVNSCLFVAKFKEISHEKANNIRNRR